MNDGWGPVQVSSHTPEWDQWRHGWWSQQLDTYNPAYHLRQNPYHRYSQSPWKPKRTAIEQLLHPENYTIPLSTHPSEPNPYFERKVETAYYTREEWGRNGQDINWNTLGTRGG
jgi:hypothetical protein